MLRWKALLAGLFLTLSSPEASAFSHTTIASDLKDPMQLAVASNGDVYLIEREGRVLRVNPSTGAIHLLGTLQVSALRETDKDSPWGRECGLLGLALAPDFIKSQQLYLYYSHPDKLQNNLSRFTLKDGLLNVASEQIILVVPTDRHQLSTHMAGCLRFGPDGCLFLSTGDNINPFDSQGYAPIDDRATREHANAMRTSGNTNDLRGKILRIKPTATGYEIPPGNLFPPGTPATKPEIFVMGCRNPFRLCLDDKTGTLYWGEVGPDAGNASDRGPAGHDEINQAKAAGNYGWPFVIANNKPYPIVDFATNKVGVMTDPAAPQNPSQFNTGLKTLPPAQSALIWYPYADSAEFPSMGSGGRNAMAGLVFYHDAKRPHNLLSAEDDRSLITYDWMRNKAWKVKLDSGERVVQVKPIIDGLMHPVDMALATDGALYILEYGSEWYFNKNGRLRRFLSSSMPEVALSIKELPNHEYEAEAPLGAAIKWYATIGQRDEVLGEGLKIRFDKKEARELRAIALGMDGGSAIARKTFDISVMPQLTLSLEGQPTDLAFGQKLTYKVSGATDLKSIVVRARYIPPTGHDAGGPMLPEAVASLVKSRQCLACHQVDARSVGPAYVDVAMRYRTEGEAAQKLVAKLKSGGGGTWGAIPMPPQSALSDAEAKEVVSAILALASGMIEVKGLSAGDLQLPSSPASLAPGGSWEISAEAPGYSSAKTRLAAK